MKAKTFGDTGADTEACHHLFHHDTTSDFISLLFIEFIRIGQEKSFCYLMLFLSYCSFCSAGDLKIFIFSFHTYT